MLTPGWALTSHLPEPDLTESTCDRRRKAFHVKTFRNLKGLEVGKAGMPRLLLCDQKTFVQSPAVGISKLVIIGSSVGWF